MKYLKTIALSVALLLVMTACSTSSTPPEVSSETSTPESSSEATSTPESSSEASTPESSSEATSTPESSSEADAPATGTLSGTLEELVTQVYEGLETELPSMGNMPIETEMSEYFLGVTADRYMEAQSGDALMSSVAHSMCLVRANSIDDVEQLKADIEANVDPRKWICVEAETVIVDSVGDVILLVMSDNATATAIQESFLALADGEQA